MRWRLDLLAELNTLEPSSDFAMSGCLFLSLFLSHCSKDLEWWTTYSSNRQSFIKQAAGSILNNRLVSALLPLSYNLNRQKAVGSALLRPEVDPCMSAPSLLASLFVLFITSSWNDWLSSINRACVHHQMGVHLGVKGGSGHVFLMKFLLWFLTSSSVGFCLFVFSLSTWFCYLSYFFILTT